MKILQFTSPNPPADMLVKQMLRILNICAGKIDRKLSDKLYGTKPFGFEHFSTKVNDPNTHWIQYDAVMPHMTAGGKELLELLIEGFTLDENDNPVPAITGRGVLQGASLTPGLGLDIFLRLVEVTDLAADGYTAPVPLPEPEPDPAPTPPAYSWPTVDPEFTVPANAWMFWEGTPPDFNAKLTHVNALKPWRDSDTGPFVATYASGGGRLPRFVMHFVDLTAEEALVWDARHITADNQTVTDGYVEWFE